MFYCAGRLQEGDQIMEANGESMAGVTNDKYVKLTVFNVI